MKPSSSSQSSAQSPQLRVARHLPQVDEGSESFATPTAATRRRSTSHDSTKSHSDNTSNSGTMSPALGNSPLRRAVKFVETVSVASRPADVRTKSAPSSPPRIEGIPEKPSVTLHDKEVRSLANCTLTQTRTCWTNLYSNVFVFYFLREFRNPNFLRPNLFIYFCLQQNNKKKTTACAKAACPHNQYVSANISPNGQGPQRHDCFERSLVRHAHPISHPLQQFVGHGPALKGQAYPCFLFLFLFLYFLLLSIIFLNFRCSANIWTHCKL
jgi:hypothetical protein